MNFQVLFQKFEPAAEKEFLSEYLNVTLMRTGAILALILMAGFGFLDIYMLPETKYTAWTIRYTISTPCVLAILFYSYSRSFKSRYTPFIMLTLLIVAYSILAMIYFSKETEPGHSYYYAGMMICIFYVGLFGELQFKNAFFVISLIFIGYVSVAVFKQNMLRGFFDNPLFGLLLNNIFFLLSSGVLSLIATYLIAKSRRTAFLQHKIIVQEKENSENLLHNILPVPIADRLKKNPKIIADKYDLVTVMFADIVGFTKLSMSPTPHNLVEFLNQIFSQFDMLTEKYGVEKIKTIGDAYMVAGGVPERVEGHLERIACMSLEMVESLHSNEIMSSDVEVRIGIHAGPVVAGVIGTHKFAYDLWGDTVNIASRMESHGVPGKINVSESVRERLYLEFDFEKRELMKVKGKGEMQTYFLIPRFLIKACYKRCSRSRHLAAPRCRC